jgi:hypothetical protein
MGQSAGDMVNPFDTTPSSSWPGTHDVFRRCPFPEQPPVIGDGGAVLDDPVIWTLFLKRLGNGDQQDAETISSFARRLGIDRNRIIAKLAAHYHDNQTLQ